VRGVADAQDLQGVSESPVSAAPTPQVDVPDVVEEAVAPEVVEPVPEMPEEPDPEPTLPDPEPTLPDPEPTLPDPEPTLPDPEVAIANPAEEVQPADAAVVGTEVEYAITVWEAKLELEFVFPCGEDEFILDAAERAGFAMPSSCRSGGCLVCAGRVESGTYEMGDQYVLEDDQIEKGFMLLCCSVPTSDGRYKSHQEDELD